MNIEDVYGDILHEDLPDQGEYRFVELDRDGVSVETERARELPGVERLKAERGPGEDGQSFLEVDRYPQRSELYPRVDDLMYLIVGEKPGEPGRIPGERVGFLEKDDVGIDGPDLPGQFLKAGLPSFFLLIRPETDGP